MPGTFASVSSSASGEGEKEAQPALALDKEAVGARLDAWTEAAETSTLGKQVCAIASYYVVSPLFISRINIQYYSS